MSDIFWILLDYLVAVCGMSVGPAEWCPDTVWRRHGRQLTNYVNLSTGEKQMEREGGAAVEQREFIIITIKIIKKKDILHPQ